MDRPECFEFAMDFLGTPENEEVRAYVERLEARIDEVIKYADGPGELRGDYNWELLKQDDTDRHLRHIRADAIDSAVVDIKTTWTEGDRAAKLVCDLREYAQQIRSAKDAN